MKKKEKQKRILVMFIVSFLVALLVLVVTAPYVSSMPLVNKATTQEVQMILSHHGYSLKMDGNFDVRTQKAVRHWQKVNGLFVDGIPGPITMTSLRESIDGPFMPAVRLNPPKQETGLNGLSFAPGGLDSCEEMVYYMNQAGLPDRFNDSGRHSNWVRSDGFGWRESKCSNTAVSSTGCCVGYWQNYISSHLASQSQYRNRIINECQVTGRSDILGDSSLQKQKQACVTKVVYDISGFSPWA